MGLTGISEFTFGFAFLYEQTNRHFAGLTAVPILPSLQQEAGEGWDARLPINGVPNYYQFKLSDYLHRSNAKYFNEDPFYTAPYYRIPLHRRNGNLQHCRLRQLSLTAPETFYVAPEINDLDAFNESFVNSDIVSVSRMIPVIDCDDIFDGDQHDITYQAGDPGWYQHSEPKRHERSFIGRDLEELFLMQREKVQRLDDEFAKQLWDRHVETTRKLIAMEAPYATPAQERLLKGPSEPNRNALLKAIAELTMNFYGSTFVIVGETRQ